MIFTIGHTNHSHEEFLELLQANKITYLLDVRSTPFSQFTSQFNKDVIADFLKKNGVNYNHMGKFFGARPMDKNLYTEQGYLDFEKARASENFKKGMDNVSLGLNKGYNIALMCTEKTACRQCRQAVFSNAALAFFFTKDPLFSSYTRKSRTPSPTNRSIHH